MRSASRRGWFVAIAAVITATAVGLIVARSVLPAGRPRPVASPLSTPIRIAPLPPPEPISSTPAPAPATRPRHKPLRPAAAHAAPDPDPVTVTLTNSW